jgi:putative phage-type endonuclease
MNRFYDVVQGSPEWHALRLGKATASRAADILARTKSGYGASRGNYMAELIIERLTGVVTEGYISQAMQWGTLHQDEARRLYALVTDCEVNDVGFVTHPKIEGFGASPDGLVTTSEGEMGLVEIKCPLPATHIATLLSGGVDGAYIAQAQAQMSCTGAPWCDFVSYDPRLNEELQLFVKRLPRDDEFIETLECEVRVFLDDLANKVADLKRRYGIVEKEAVA